MRLTQSAMNQLAAARGHWLLGIALAALAGTAAHVVTSLMIERDAEQRFIHNVTKSQASIAARIKSYTDVLRGGASLLNTYINDIKRDKFTLYVRGLGLRQNFPGIVNFNYAEYVPGNARAQFEQRLALERLTSGGVVPQIKIIPPHEREEYLVVTIIEPPFSQGLGRDLLVFASQSKTYDKMRGSGEMSSSGVPIRPVSSPQTALLGLRAPIYRADMDLGTVAERQAAYRGSLGISFSVPLLVVGVLAELPVKNVRLTLVDTNRNASVLRGAAQGGPMRLYDSKGSARDPFPAPDQGDRVFSVTLPIEFSGRNWDATFSTDKVNLHSALDQRLPAIVAGLAAGGVALMYSLLHSLAAVRRRKRDHHNLRLLTANAEQVKEDERKRIAREIHDDLGQNLLALRIETDLLCERTRGSQSRLHARASRTRDHIDATIKSMRQIINDLRPLVLDLGLADAIDWQLSQVRLHHKIDCVMVYRAHAEALDEQRATACFRILQEGLSNVIRHARASKVTVQVEADERFLTLTVKDDGIGIPSDAAAKAGSFGLIGMRERVSMLGGGLTIGPGYPCGTCLIVAFPLARAAPQRRTDWRTRYAAAFARLSDAPAPHPPDAGDAGPGKPAHSPEPWQK